MIYRRLIIPCLIALAFFVSWVVYSIGISDTGELKSTIQGGASNFVFLIAGIVGTYIYGMSSEAEHHAKQPRETSSPIMLGAKAAVALPVMLAWLALLVSGLTAFADKLEAAQEMSFTATGYQDIQKELGGVIVFSSVIPFYAMFMFHAGAVSRKVAFIPILVSVLPALPLISFLSAVTKVAVGKPFFVGMVDFVLGCILALGFSILGWGAAKIGHLLNWRASRL